MMTTIMQMPMDFLEIPEPSLPWGILELADEAKYVDVGSGQSCYTEEVQSQEAGLTRLVLVTIMECSSSVLKEGAMIAPGISTESIPPMFSAGRCYPVDQLGLVGHWDKTEQSVLPGSDTKMRKPIPQAQWAQTSHLNKFSQWLKARWVSISHIAQWAQTECFPRAIQINRWMKAQWASMSHETRWVQTECFPRVIPISQWLMARWARRVYWVQWTPEGCFPSVNWISQWLLAQWASYLLPARWARVGWYLIMPVGLTETPNQVDETERPIQIDFMKIVQTDGPASLVDTPPWENMSISMADTDTAHNGRPGICSPTGRCVSDTREPPNTKDGESDELSSSGSQNCNKDSQHNECMDFISDREPTSAEGTWEEDGTCSDDLDIILETGAPAVPRTELQTQIRNVTIRRKENSSVSSGTDGRNLTLVTRQIFRRMKRSHSWNNSPVVEYPVVNVRVVSNIWNGTRMT